MQQESQRAVLVSGAVRCGKLLDVRSGRMLTDQIIAFDANGMITAVRFTCSSRLNLG
jgi:hypothetical protein